MTQEDALNILKTGKNMFLTGEPGSGKSHVINEYVAYLRNCGIEPSITASTGIAATHIGGMTIHSWSGAGIRTSMTPDEFKGLEANKNVSKRIRKAKVLIIDEVSMLLPDMLSLVNMICKIMRGDSQPFGGLQVIFVGDFFQLPPINRENSFGNRGLQDELFESDSPRGIFAYSSSAWAEADPKVCYLTEQHRQDDPVFLGILSAIRQNSFNEDHLTQLESARLSRETNSSSALRLYTHNANVDKVNDEMLSRISGQATSYEMTGRGPDAMIAGLKKGCLSPEVLSLKIGASVMFTKNSPKDNFVNGTLGAVYGFDEESGYPIIKTRSGRHITVSPMDWGVESDGYMIAKITQIPLRLAWAITVHKSQGMSLDEAIIDLSNVFEYGQGYVALSRVRRLKGLCLLGWNARAFEVHPEILYKDAIFHEQSMRAENEISLITSADLENQKKDFIKKIGGDIPSSDGIITEKQEQKPAITKELKPDTYSLTLELWNQGDELDQIALKREIKPETVLTHLATLKSQSKVSQAELVQRLVTPEIQNSLAEIQNIILSSEDFKLKPIFDKLEGKFSYKDIKIAMILL